jgi:translocation and assembly module TamB
MTTDSTPPPPDGAPPPRRPRRLWTALAWTVGVPVLLVALAAGALYGAATTARGTAYVWQGALKLLGGRLTGTLEGGTLATGLRLRGIEWRSFDGSGTDIRIDHVDGRWALSGRPWRFAIDYLHVGTIDARLGSSGAPSSGPPEMPHALRLPLPLRISDVRVDRLVLHDGATTRTFSDFRFHGRSDGIHHEASIDSLDTPFGAVTASLKLDGAQPYALSGTVGYTGKVENEPVQVDARLSGTLAQLVAEVDASGLKLNGHAHVEAQPFAPVPLRRVTLRVDHVDPKAFAPGAPSADLALRADLQPASAGATAPGGFAVAGDVSIVNAQPGTLVEHRLPLVDAHAQVRLDAHTQHIDGLAVRLVRGATVTGAGSLSGKTGRFDLQVAGLDLNTFETHLRPTRLAGPIGIRLDNDTQTLTLDLADPKAQLRAQGKVIADPARVSFSDVRVSAGGGRVDLSGELKHDADAHYRLKAIFTDFDPLGLAARPPARASSPPGHGRARGAARTAATGPARTGARVNGTLAAQGALGPVFSTKAEFRLGDSVYDGLPLTGGGTVQLAGQRLLPSRASLSIAGNQVDLQGSFGRAGDRLSFHVDAPALARLGFGLAGAVSAQGDVTGSIAHPDVVLDYKADDVVLGANRVGHAQGHAELRDGANGALAFTTDARDLHTGDLDLATLTARLAGTRARHTLDAQASGKIGGQPLDLALAAQGRLTDERDGTHWDGTLTRLQSGGTVQLDLQAPLAVSAGPGGVTLGATRLVAEGAVLDLKSLAFGHDGVRSSGTLTNISLARLLALRARLSGEPASSSARTDLVLDGAWDFALGHTARGYAELRRRSGDVSVEIGSGAASLGITALSARADFSGGNRLSAVVHAQASRIGTFDANASTLLTSADGLLTLGDDAPLAGTVTASMPSLRNTGGLLGPTYLLDGRLALKLTLAGTVAKPELSGSLAGDGLAATLVDQGVQLKDGVVRIALTRNLVDFQQVEFHGASGTLRATGRVGLDSAEPDLTARIVADKLELFAAPDRKLSLSGSATIANGGQLGAIDINGQFTVDHALFDMPEDAAPKLGDDVVVMRADGTVPRRATTSLAAGDKPASRFAPHADVSINLGRDFRFRGAGADLGLMGTVNVRSAPGQTLLAVGDVRVTQGSTYTAFGRKLAIENGYFTFNGPVSNPGINILAMRRNQQVEAGVQVTGTVNAPVAKLVSEPNVPDNEKLSWLLFGHGTDQGNNLSQQSTMTAALALLGNAGGKRIAQTFGLDEFSIGTSDVGLTDPQVVMISKALNQRFVLGYEQGLQSASNAIKATVNLSRYWSVMAFGGTFQGVSLLYTRRFDHWPWPWRSGRN